MVLDGSPRKRSNTSALAEAFSKGAREAGNEVIEFFLDSMDIHGCKGCCGGHSAAARPCVQKDDMVQIYPAVRDADVVVFASPLYYWTVSAQLKVAIDRLYALEEGDGQRLRGNGKAGALLMAAAGDAFGDVLTYFDHLMEHLQWENLGSVLAGGNSGIGDIEGKPEVEQAYLLGKSL